MWVCRQVEAELLRVGGSEAVADAQTEAEWYAALYFPWDGEGDEPLERIGGRLEILMSRLDSARGAQGELG